MEHQNVGQTFNVLGLTDLRV